MCTVSCIKKFAKYSRCLRECSHGVLDLRNLWLREAGAWACTVRNASYVQECNHTSWSSRARTGELHTCRNVIILREVREHEKASSCEASYTNNSLAPTQQPHSSELLVIFKTHDANAAILFQLLVSMASDAKSYVVRFEGNSSKQWDGKEVYINAEVLDELYSKEELVHSAQVTVPWKLKGKISHWKAIYIDPSAPTQQPGKFPNWDTI